MHSFTYWLISNNPLLFKELDRRYNEHIELTKLQKELENKYKEHEVERKKEEECGLFKCSCPFAE